MKTTTTLLFLLTLIFFLSEKSFSQVGFTATVTNQEVIGTEVSFDLFLQANNPVEPLYLGHADFVLYFNDANFTAPTFEYIDGSNDLTNSNGTPTTSYNDNIVTAPSFLASGLLVINLNMPTFANQSQFDTRIARITDTPGVHKLGRFTVTGISNPTGTFGLQWKTSLPGVYTTVQSLGNTDPWMSSPASGNYPIPFDEPLPVSISSFTGQADRNTVLLAWTTEWEENNEKFNIQRRSLIESVTEGEDIFTNWETISSVAGAGTTYETVSYSYSDRNLITTKYEYRLVAIDYNGNATTDNEHTIGVEVGIPTSFELSQNYPNPFNPTTKINYEIPVESNVRLSVYDMTGREVATLVNSTVTPGYFTIDFNASSFASGVYFYRLVTSNNVLTKRMVLVK